MPQLAGQQICRPAADPTVPPSRLQPSLTGGDSAGGADSTRTTTASIRVVLRPLPALPSAILGRRGGINRGIIAAPKKYVAKCN